LTSSRYLHLTTWWLQREIGCATVVVLAWAEERAVAAHLALIERAMVHLHAGACGGVRECPQHACGAIDGVAAHESVNPACASLTQSIMPIALKPSPRRRR
jgi:hypothetical protein